jgi:transcription-repair coupling factor (superfamily II helicase)
MNTTIQTPPLPKIDNTKKQKWQWGELPQKAFAFQMAQAYLANPEKLLVVFVENNQILESATKLCLSLGIQQQDCLSLPDAEVLPYDLCSPAPELTAKRIQALSTLPTLKKGIIWVSQQSLFDRFAPKEVLACTHASWKIGQSITHQELIQQFIANGYQRVNRVEHPGEFAVRGSIIDCFISGMPHPVRIDHFDDTIDSLRLFDTDTQVTLEKVNTIECLPADPITLNQDRITLFRQNWRDTFGIVNDCPMYDAISNGEKLAGSEHYLPLFFNHTDTIFEYLPKQSIIIFSENFKQQCTHYETRIDQRYEQYRYDRQRPLLPPKQLFLNSETIFQNIKNYDQITCFAERINEQVGHWNLDYTALGFSPESINAKIPFKDLLTWQAHYPGKIILSAESEGRSTILYDQLSKHLALTVNNNFHDALSHNNKINLIVSPMEDGFCLEQLAIITENDLFAGHITQTKQTSEESSDPTLRIRSLSELQIDDLVVHRQHGIGKYHGLKNITTGDHQAEYMELLYANEDKIFVPIAQLHLISRFLTANEAHSLNTLGKGQWQKQKQKAIKQIRDIASDLLKLYSERQSKQGQVIEANDTDYKKFADSFYYTETPDQAKAIESTIQELRKPQPLDRLVCGDVGFGKTEIGLRASFVAASAGKQVVFIAPTTLLAQQHYETFKNRFANWPIEIAGLSRFNNSTEQKIILENLANGKLDIIVGTHRLLSKDIKFKNLGLVIIDEEHRFGVAQKEKLTHLKTNVDILSLTATPIPRSLNMAFEGLRDISIIATPPENRLNIQTFFREFNMGMIKEAVERERMRGGQIYFIHNDIATLQAQADALQEAMPHLKIAVAHGRTPKNQLQKIMLDFYHQRINCLVCTTIVESGLDVPTANTIIINRSDKLGLAQLHQLRGRVGRSHHQAYAYLMVPCKRTLTSDSKRRLEAITRIDSLGAGFDLANQDLEIRGAGELLGAEQSGHIHSIGYTLYMDLLKEAIHCFEQGKDFNPTDDKDELSVDVGVSCLLPDEYIGDVGIRLSLYKRLSDMHTEKAVSQFQAELIDRFGPLPLEASQLLRTAKLRLICETMGIESVTCGTQYLTIRFNAKANINVDALLKLIQLAPRIYRLKDNQTLQIKCDADKLIRLEQVENCLEALKIG